MAEGALEPKQGVAGSLFSTFRENQQTAAQTPNDLVQIGKNEDRDGLKVEATKVGANGIILGTLRVDMGSCGNIDGKAIFVDEKREQ